MDDSANQRIAKEFASLLEALGVTEDKKKMFLGLSYEQKVNMINAQKRVAKTTGAEIVSKLRMLKRPFSTSYTITDIEKCVEGLKSIKFLFNTLTEADIERMLDENIVQEAWGLVKMLLPDAWPSNSQVYICVNETKQNKPIFIILEPAVQFFKAVTKSPAVIKYIEHNPEVFKSILEVFPSPYLFIASTILDIAIKCMNTQMTVILTYLFQRKEKKEEHISCSVLCGIRIKYIIDELYFNMSLSNVPSEYLLLFNQFLLSVYSNCEISGILMNSMLYQCGYNRILNKMKEYNLELKASAITMIEKQEYIQYRLLEIDVLNNKDKIDIETYANIISIVNVLSALYKVNSSKVYDVLNYIMSSIFGDTSWKEKQEKIRITKAHSAIEEYNSANSTPSIGEVQHNIQKITVTRIEQFEHLTPGTVSNKLSKDTQEQKEERTKETIQSSTSSEGISKDSMLKDQGSRLDTKCNCKCQCQKKQVQEREERKGIEQEHISIKPSNEKQEIEPVKQREEKTIPKAVIPPIPTEKTSSTEQKRVIEVRVPEEKEPIARTGEKGMETKEIPSQPFDKEAFMQPAEAIKAKEAIKDQVKEASALKPAKPPLPPKLPSKSNSLPQLPQIPAAPVPPAPKIPMAKVKVPGAIPPVPKGVSGAKPPIPSMPRAGPNIPESISGGGIPMPSGGPALSGPRAQYIEMAKKLHPANPRPISFEMHLRKPAVPGIWSKLDKEELSIFTSEDFKPFERLKAQQIQAIDDCPITTAIDKIIEEKKGKAIDIILARVKVSHSELVKAVDALDVAPFTETLLIGLLANYPTEEELDQICKQEVYLAPEKFYKQALEISQFKEKLCIVHLKLITPSIKSAFIPNISKLINGYSELRNNSQVQKTLQISLSAINIINSGKRHEGAWGIKIETLPRLLENVFFHSLIHTKISELYPDSTEIISLFQEVLEIPADLVESDCQECLTKQEILNTVDFKPGQLEALKESRDLLILLQKKHKELKDSIAAIRSFYNENDLTSASITTLIKYLISVWKGPPKKPTTKQIGLKGR
ncbi:hypothetical protein NEOKW01_0579 [Nematocida sp. AWRm80]|nr:hypothetical protein NEOKW01_0579 [Nematocida sp. AWRm80]